MNDGCVKISVDEQFWEYWHWKQQGNSPLFPLHPDARLELQQLVLSGCLNAFTCFHVCQCLCWQTIEEERDGTFLSVVFPFVMLCRKAEKLRTYFCFSQQYVVAASPGYFFYFTGAKLANCHNHCLLEKNNLLLKWAVHNNPQQTLCLFKNRDTFRGFSLFHKQNWLPASSRRRWVHIIKLYDMHI